MPRLLRVAYLHVSIVHSLLVVQLLPCHDIPHVLPVVPAAAGLLTGARHAR